jgi:endo-1,3-1,4-beta-glycanase ExoK
MRLVNKALFALAAMTTLSTPALAQNSFVEDFSKWQPTVWNVRDGSNGDFFGCTFRSAGTFVNTTTGKLELKIGDNGPSTDKYRCGELFTKKQNFGYAKYLVQIQPSFIKGSNSSFFLYYGPSGGGKADHYEIDMEFIVDPNDGKKKLHTNYFVKGSDNGGKNVQRFEVSTGSRQYGFQWTSTGIRWFKVEGGKEIDLRKVDVKITQQMGLFMNHWYSNSRSTSQEAKDSIGFLGTYDGSEGTAFYDKVEVYW